MSWMIDTRFHAVNQWLNLCPVFVITLEQISLFRPGRIGHLKDSVHAKFHEHWIEVSSNVQRYNFIAHLESQAFHQCLPQSFLTMIEKQIMYKGVFE